MKASKAFEAFAKDTAEYTRAWMEAVRKLIKPINWMKKPRV
jgi:hypothetical protein